jgi:hypothetical protein
LETPACTETRAMFSLKPKKMPVLAGNTLRQSPFETDR